jgi:hypothetical protein
MTPEQIAKLEEWRAAKANADAVKSIVQKEQQLRKEIFELFFPEPKEGTNTLELPEGWKLKGVFKLTRNIDEAALSTVTEHLREIGVNADTLVQWKPSLKLATYKELTAEQRNLMDEAIVCKPGSPTVELVAPKEKA